MEYTYSNDGFCGKLFISDNKKNKHVVFVLQGMAGYEHAAEFADLLARNGIDAN